MHVQGDFVGDCDVYTAHSCHKAWLEIVNKENLGGALERLKKSVYNPLHHFILKAEKNCIMNTRRVIAISNGIKEEITRLYGVEDKKVKVIPNGVNIEQFNMAQRKLYRKEIRTQLGLGDDEILLIFPAHEFIRKGILKILDAMNSLKNKRLHLLVVGRDDQTRVRDVIEHYQLESNIHFIGETSTIEKYYAASDIMVLPTLYEPFGLVITEAMASALPVITNKSAGAAELIENGTDGVLLEDIKDTRELASQIESLANNSAKREQMGVQARITAERYNWDAIAQRTMNLYNEILTSKRY
ncbi:MAG: hypothetical protein A2298_05535 [Gammaproteobacteria bacterium RIFOXYB2_FULL_38_6]|nr:MAG: hypothetical protein A2298_05535 [Gammaproteobacteria bacterium RIFOXYB2_FULL_38_6]